MSNWFIVTYKEVLTHCTNMRRNGFALVWTLQYKLYNNAYTFTISMNASTEQDNLQVPLLKKINIK